MSKKFSKDAEEFHENPSDEDATFVRKQTDGRAYGNDMADNPIRLNTCYSMSAINCTHAIGNARFIGLTLRALGQ
jgi:hypothetical protein